MPEVPERIAPVVDRDFFRDEVVDLDPVAIDDDIDTVTITVDRARLAGNQETDICELEVFVVAPGRPALKLAGATFRGGVHVTRRGHISPYTTITVSVPVVRGRQIVVRPTVKEPTRLAIESDHLIRKAATVADRVDQITPTRG